MQGSNVTCSKKTQTIVLAAHICRRVEIRKEILCRAELDHGVLRHLRAPTVGSRGAGAQPVEGRRCVTRAEEGEGRPAPAPWGNHCRAQPGPLWCATSPHWCIAPLQTPERPPSTRQSPKTLGLHHASFITIVSRRGRKQILNVPTIVNRW